MSHKFKISKIGCLLEKKETWLALYCTVCTDYIQFIYLEFHIRFLNPKNPHLIQKVLTRNQMQIPIPLLGHTP